jgi:hypothetical protein
MRLENRKLNYKLIRSKQDSKTFFQQYWALATQYGIALIAVISSIIYAPQFPDFQQKDSKYLAQFLAASILLILFIPINKWNKPKHQTAWWSASIVFFIMTLGLIYYYQRDLGLKSSPYLDSRVIVGNLPQMKPRALAQKEKVEQHWGKPFSVEECIYMNGGKTKDLWDESLLLDNYQQLLMEYCMVVIGAALFSISIVQSIKCQNRKLTSQNEK